MALRRKFRLKPFQLLKNHAFPAVQSMAVLGVMSSSTTNTNMVPGSGSGSSPPTGAKRWYFSEHQLVNTPSLRAGIPLEKELSYRQQAANFIQDMGQRLEV